jgi:PAS domain S-box-containing protein
MSHSVVERELSLRNSEKRFRSLVNSLEGIVFEIKFPDMEFIFVSERSEHIIGYSAEEWLETSDFWQEHIHPDDRDWAYNYNLNQAAAGHNYQFEYRLMHRDGHVVWVRQMVNLVVEEGKTTRLLGVLIDVTSSKEAAISLQESEQRFRSLVEQAADAIYIFDFQGQLIDVNEQSCRSLAYSREELKKKNISDIQILQPPLEFISLQNSVMRGGSLTFEAEHRRKNNQLIPVEIRLGSFRYQDQPLFLALVRDIADRKKAEAALKESEERVRLLLDSTAEGIFGLDCDAKCTFCNVAGLKLLGFEDEQGLLGKNVHELFHHSPDNQDYPQEDCPICNVLITGKQAHSDSESFAHTDGNLFPVEYFAQPIVKDENLVGVVVVFHDVTERKLLQQQSIRTAQLASLGELAAGVAHEINNPISGVINYTQILLNRYQGDDDEKELLERILKEGERVATIVRDLLFFARESGPEMVLSNIRDVLADSLSLSAAQIRKEGIQLQVECVDDLPLVNTRAQQIQQLFLNVLSNARHALGEKYPSSDKNKKIEISITTVEHDGVGYVRILFKDYGAGISKPMLERVMHPFVTTKPTGVGTGLGLSISFEIVKKHGGLFWIESVEGESTEVYIDLPVARKD